MKGLYFMELIKRINKYEITVEEDYRFYLVGLMFALCSIMYIYMEKYDFSIFYIALSFACTPCFVCFFETIYYKVSMLKTAYKIKKIYETGNSREIDNGFIDLLDNTNDNSEVLQNFFSEVNEK